VASDSSGLKGATLGQFYDLFPRSNELNHLEKIIELKTITLFRSAFCFGWLFGGGGMDRLEMVSDLSYHFGLAFQVMDDLLDIDQDLENQNHKNFAIVLGKERAIDLVEGEVSLFQEMARSLGIYTPEISLMTDMLLSYAFASSKTRA
jgi:geranylgeranyl diphosphate synthase type II